MSLEKFYKKYNREIWCMGIMTIILAVGMATSYNIGYERGQDDYIVPSPEYEISSYSMRMNATFYNYTYYALTRDDMISSSWILDIELRDDYFMLCVNINTKSDNWTDFYVFVNKAMSYWNITIELISIHTVYRYSQTSRVVNFYDGSYGGTWCQDMAQIYFLGYGDIDIEGVGIAISSLVSIRGHFK